DLLIAHQDELEDVLARFFTDYTPEIVGNDYLVIGTVDRADWKHISQNQLPVQDTIEALHDFKEVVTFKPAWGWARKRVDLPIIIMHLSQLPRTLLDLQFVAP